MGKTPTRVWCIDLDAHREFGYQPVSDEELLRSREDVGASEWVDPRFGELYQIAFEVEKDSPGQGEMYEKNKSQAGRTRAGDSCGDLRSAGDW
jgi:hypothetical protein